MWNLTNKLVNGTKKETDSKIVVTNVNREGGRGNWGGGHRGLNYYV